jgi:MinD superfamily P-loop ATPase
VDAPNLGLILRPDMLEEQSFVGGKRAVIIQNRCTACGRCAEVCRFEAVTRAEAAFRIDSLACEGCAACFCQCPAEAIRMDDCLSGTWYHSQTRFGPFVHARLHPGEENSGKLVSTVRQQAFMLADQTKADWVLIDGSPGIGCPVIAAVTGTDLALLVTEPTVSGIHDLQRALQVTEHFRVPSVVCVNKSDINPRLSQDIAQYCSEQQIPMLGQIPYDEIVLAAMRQGLAVTEMPINPVGEEIRVLWEALQASL